MSVSYSIVAVVLVLVSYFSCEATAQRISYQGTTFQLVDWNSVVDDVADGTSGQLEVAFEAFDFQSSEPFTFVDYENDEGFDNLNFSQNDDIETMRITGGFLGLSTLSIEASVSELLILLGVPGDDNSCLLYTSPSPRD